MKDAGVTLPEALLGLTLLAVLASLGLPGLHSQLSQRQLDLSLQHLANGLEAARAQAERRGEPCGLSLGGVGWESAENDHLPSCLAPEQGMHPAATSPSSDTISLRHNFPKLLRISSNGLVIDGGTMVLSAKGSDRHRCLVMSPPLGVVRFGRYQGNPSTELNSSACVPDPSL